MLTKVIIWVLMILITIAAGGIGYCTYAFTRTLREITTVSRYGGSIDEDSADLRVHDTYMSVGVGRFRLEVYPRLWAAILIILGLLAIAVGLIFILHVSLPHSA